jgi:hypothetical protein
MNSSSSIENEHLVSLKSDYIEALGFYKRFRSEESLIRLNTIKEAYLSFIGENDVRVTVGRFHFDYTKE